jgi:hypothetical protein
MPIVWNSQAEARVSYLYNIYCSSLYPFFNNITPEQLFAYVLKIHGVKLNYPALAEAMGDGASAKAISCHISNMKTKANNEEGGSRSSTASPAKKKTVAKRKAPESGGVLWDGAEKGMVTGKKIKIAPGVF